jgi:hypothetical protein
MQINLRAMKYVLQTVCSLPDIAYLVIDRKISYSDVDLLVNVPIIPVEIKNNIFGYFLHNL